MKITKTSVELPEARFKALAQFMGWTEQVMTTDLSPNVPIDNPQSFTDYIIEKDSAFMKDILVRFNLQEAEILAKQKRDEANQILEDAKVQAEQIASGLFEVIVE